MKTAQGECIEENKQTEEQQSPFKNKLKFFKFNIIEVIKDNY